MAVTVTATDSGSLTDTATRTWTVRANQDPTVTISTTGGQQTGGATVDLDATVSAPETGQTVTVLWEITAGTGTIASATSATNASITLPAETTTAQTITVRITATDAVGATDTDSVTFTIPAATVVDLMPTLPAIADQSATVGTVYLFDLHSRYRWRHAPSPTVSVVIRRGFHCLAERCRARRRQRARTRSQSRSQTTTVIPTPIRSF